MATRRGFGNLRKLPSGNWQARYTGPDGAWHNAPVTFRTKGDAEGWLGAERKLISSGMWTPAAARKAAGKVKPMTFGEYAPIWLKGRKVKGEPLKPKTRDGYQDSLDLHILPTFRDVPLRSITRQTVDDWYERMNPDYPTARARAYSLLRTILGTAVEHELIEGANPARVRGGGSVKRKHDPRPATPAEVALIADQMPEGRRLMIGIAAWCGLRYGEITELRRKDIDVKNMEIRLRRGVTWVRDPENPRRYMAVVGDVKSDAGSREVPIPPHLSVDVREHLLEHTAPGKEGLLFPARGGGHLRGTVFNGEADQLDPDTDEVVLRGWGWYAARQRADRPDLHFHDLRHTALSRLAEAGATAAELLAFGGHSDAAVAMRYQHAASERLHVLAGKLSEMADGS